MRTSLECNIGSEFHCSTRYFWFRGGGTLRETRLLQQLSVFSCCVKRQLEMCSLPYVIYKMLKKYTFGLNNFLSLMPIISFIVMDGFKLVATFILSGLGIAENFYSWRKNLPRPSASLHQTLCFY